MPSNLTASVGMGPPIGSPLAALGTTALNTAAALLSGSAKFSGGHVQLELEEGQLRGLPDGLAHHECVDERHVHEVVEEALVVPPGLGQNPKKNIVELKTE